MLGREAPGGKILAENFDDLRKHFHRRYHGENLSVDSNFSIEILNISVEIMSNFPLAQRILLKLKIFQLRIEVN